MLLMRPRPDSCRFPVLTRVRIWAMMCDLFRYCRRGDGRSSSRLPALAVSLNGYQYYDTAAAVTCALLRGVAGELLRTGRIST